MCMFLKLLKDRLAACKYLLNNPHGSKISFFAHLVCLSFLFHQNNPCLFSIVNSMSDSYYLPFIQPLDCDLLHCTYFLATT